MYKSRLLRIQLLMTVIITVLTMVYILTTKYYDIETSQLTTIFVIVGVISLLLLTLYLYLERSSSEIREETSLSRSEMNEMKYILKDVLSSSSFQKDEVLQLRDSIIEATKNLNEIKNVGFEIDDTNKSKISEILKEKIQADLTVEIIKELKERYSYERISETYFSKIKDDFKEVKRRMINEVDKLSSRANLNLAIGATSSIVAIAILGITVWVKPETMNVTTDMVSYLLPRVSLVIFIEIFAFFFLRLYKATLGDIKYYQNELTNIDLKTLALKSAIMHKEKDLIIPILSELSKTERNFKIGKDETTIDLERMRHNQQSNQSIIDFVKNFLSNNSKNG